MYVESYQWPIGLERVFVLPLAPHWVQHSYLSLPPLGIATTIPCTWGLSIAQAKEEMAAENPRMATEQAALDAQAQRIQAESFRLTLDQNASNEIMRRRHQSRLPPVYDARNLFNMPGAGASDPHVVNRAVEVPVTGAGSAACCGPASIGYDSASACFNAARILF